MLESWQQVPKLKMILFTGIQLVGAHRKKTAEKKERREAWCEEQEALRFSLVYFMWSNNVYVQN